MAQAVVNVVEALAIFSKHADDALVSCDRAGYVEVRGVYPSDLTPEELAALEALSWYWQESSQRWSGRIGI
jgi:hypothetical protein